MEKQKEILSAALKLFVEFGFHGTPTSKIAKEAGVANGTLFHYYKTKDDLVLALYKDIKTRLSDFIYSGINKDDSQKVLFKTIYLNTIQWSVENSAEFYFIQQFHSSPFLSLISREEIAKQAQPHLDLIQTGIKNKVLKPHPVDFLYTMINSHIVGINQYLSSTNLSEEKQKKVVADSFDLLWDMIS